MTRFHRFAGLFALTVILVLVGCSGPPQATTGDRGDGDATSSEERADRMPTPRASVADYETFDPTTYDVPPPRRKVRVKHSVPERLLSSRADEGVTQTVEGFRIQVYSAQDKQASEEFRERVRQWWQRAKDEAPSDVFSTQPPIVIEYAQPYYRVRFGAFAERDVAEEALAFVQREFSDAFMARSTVTVTR